jgi:hypothetical protein
MEASMPQANNNTITIPLPRALPTAARKKVETAIECHLAAVAALTAFLDEADSDPDLEPSLAGTNGDDREYDPADPPAHEGIDDNELDVSYNEGHGRGGSAGCDSEDMEHSLGWTNAVNQDAAIKGGGNCFSFGGGQWGSQMSGEPEPSLGSLDGQIDQTHWAHGDRRDMEQEHDGREPECEDEGAEHDGREPPCSPFELVQD